MNILLTGVAGFIASRIAAFLLDDGHTVVGVDNMNDSYDVRLKEHRLAGLSGRDGFHFLRADIANRAAVREAWQSGMAHCGGGAGEASYDGVVNLAARAGVRPSVDDPWVYMDTNAGGNLNLLDLCREYGVRKYVLASTSSLYGAHNPLPYSEEADTNRALSPSGVPQLTSIFHQAPQTHVPAPETAGPRHRPHTGVASGALRTVREDRTMGSDRCRRIRR